MNYQERVKRLQAAIRRRKQDAMLVSQPENRRYLSGFCSGDHGIGELSAVLLVPAKGEAHLITDFRFQLQAEKECPQCRLHIHKKGIFAYLEKLLPDLGIKKLLFESDYTLHSVALKMQENLGKKKIALMPIEGLIEGMRIIKDEEEIEAMRKSVLLNEQVFETIYSSLLDYETEIDVAIALESTMRRMGAEAPSFDSIVASGERGALPHAVPGGNKLQQGKSLTIDMGLVLDGYCSDMTRTFALGKPDEKYMQIHRIVRKAQLAGMDALRAGVTGASVDKAARKVIEDAGYGRYFGHGLGHGVGLAVHESPRLSPSWKKKLQAGMVVTVEPGIYIPGWGGVRLEDMFVVREDGYERLNTNDTWLNV